MISSPQSRPAEADKHASAAAVHIRVSLPNPVECARGEEGLSASPWCGSPLKRVFDVLGAAVLLGITFPFLMVLGLAVLMSSSGPVLLVQERLGRYGRTFRLLKFRTLRHSVEDPGPLLTGTNDPRQTRVGRWLRESKLDELPQLWNVLRGDMSLVGPRPHLPQLWDNALAGAAEVLSIRPGLTSLAALEFYREHEQLEAAEEDSIERFYLAELLPQKIHRNLDYAARASFRTDMAVLVSTLTYSTIHLFTVLRRILRIGHSPLPMQ